MNISDMMRRFARNPSEYREHLIVDVDGAPKRFGEVMDDWQREDFASLDPGLLRCLGRSQEPSPKMRAYFERARGSSKTTDISVTACYLLAFAPRVLKTYAFAADRDQAALLKDACHRLTRLNPWLRDILQVDAKGVKNVACDHPGEGSTLSIETSDVGSSYGLLADAIFYDEICHWSEAGAALWASILSTVAKRRSCLLVGISNAGFIDTWQHDLREAIKDDPAWVFSRKEGPASWISEEALEEQRRLLPASQFSRLWKNEWSSGDAEPALAPADIAAAFRTPCELEMFGSEPSYNFVAGLDLGISRDHVGLVVLAVRKNEDRDDTSQLRLAHVRRWAPPKGHKIDLMAVEDEIRRVAQQFDSVFGIDPWQAELLAQRLSFDGIEVRHVTPTSKTLRDQATKLREVFMDRRIQLYDREGLREDIERLQIAETSYGFRLLSPRDRKRGHGDVASALCNALSIAGEITGADAPRIAQVF